MNDWLVVWNMNFMTFHILGNNNPNWRSHIFQRGRLNHQPDDISKRFDIPFLQGPCWWNFSNHWPLQLALSIASSWGVTSLLAALALPRCSWGGARVARGSDGALMVFSWHFDRFQWWSSYCCMVGNGGMGLLLILIMDHSPIPY